MQQLKYFSALCRATELISPYLGGRPFRYQYFSLKNVLMMRDIDLFELNIPTP